MIGDDLLLDQRIAEVLHELDFIRQQREACNKEHKAMILYRENLLDHAKERLRRLIKRGNDTKLYNQALQTVFSNAMPQQYVLQRQALLLQMLHKTDMCTQQSKVIQDTSNLAVNHMMVEASVIEKELKVIKEANAETQREYTSQTLKMELEYLARLDVQTEVIQRLNMIVYPDGLGADATKFDELSVGTTETMQESSDDMTPVTYKSLKEVFRETVWTIMASR